MWFLSLKVSYIEHLLTAFDGGLTGTLASKTKDKGEGAATVVPSFLSLEENNEVIFLNGLAEYLIHRISESSKPLFLAIALIYYLSKRNCQWSR